MNNRSFMRPNTNKFSSGATRFQASTNALPIGENESAKKIKKSFKKIKDSSEWWSYARVFFTCMGSILIYGLLTNISLLNNGIYTPDPAAHNLAFIISCIVSGGAIAFASFSYLDDYAVYTSPVDAALSWFHGRPDTTFWHTVFRILGQLAGAFICAGALFLFYQDNARVKLAASVVNPLNIPTNGDAFSALCFETIGTVVLALVIFILDAQHRERFNSSLIKGIVMICVRLSVFQYTTASFNVFLSLAINATTNQWSTFAANTYYIFWVAGIVGLVTCAILIKLVRFLAREFAELKKRAYLREESQHDTKNKFQREQEAAEASARAREEAEGRAALLSQQNDESDEESR